MLTVDIFCEVIDNFGDIGVVYRFSRSLYNKYDKNVKIRVVLSSIKELMKLNKEVVDTPRQTVQGIEYMTFDYLEENKGKIIPSEVIVESFGCDLPEWYFENAKENSSLLINLEYLSSEEWTLDLHLMESLIGAPKLKKYFFMPGLSERSGGVLLTDPSSEAIKLSQYSDYLTEEFLEDKLVGTVFSYEHSFINLFKSLNKLEGETVLLCMGDKTQASVANQLDLTADTGYKGIYGRVHVFFLPFIEQDRYDALLPLCDFNLVRGEDSFVRAVLSKKPFLWHIYLQEDMVHLEKMEGFLKVYREYFEGSPFIEEMEEYSKLSIDYNIRKRNSYEDTPKEDFDYFFDNLHRYSEISTKFGDHIYKKCDLIDKFFRFINQKLEIK